MMIGATKSSAVKRHREVRLAMIIMDLPRAVTKATKGTTACAMTAGAILLSAAK